MGQDNETVTRSSRSPDELRARLQTWMALQLPDRNPEVLEVRAPTSNGMSSETLLLDVVWDEVDGRRAHELVARVAPSDADVPVFPTYDLAAQYRAMALVAERTDVPVPGLRWLEEDTDVLGGEFFIMDRVDGRVPPDLMPYTFEGWLLDADPADRRRLQDASVALLAGIHTIPASAAIGAGLAPSGLASEAQGGGASALRVHLEGWREYYEWMRNGRRLALVEEAFDWMEEHWPHDEGPASLSWGDARIGNVIYDGYTPAAVLDWEMVGVAPAGVDVGWMVFLHTFFQDIAEQMGLGGLPEMFRIDDVVATYVGAGGAELADLDVYVVYAALRHALVMARVHDRRVHFGEAAAVDDPDDAIMHRARLAELLSTSPRR